MPDKDFVFPDHLPSAPLPRDKVPPIRELAPLPPSGLALVKRLASIGVDTWWRTGDTDFGVQAPSDFLAALAHFGGRRPVLLAIVDESIGRERYWALAYPIPGFAPYRLRVASDIAHALLRQPGVERDGRAVRLDPARLSLQAVLRALPTETPH